MYFDLYDKIHEKYSYLVDIQILKKLCHSNLQDYRVFEVGCGTGKHTLLLSPLFKSVIAIDQSEEMIKRAKKNIQHSGLSNIEVHHENIVHMDQLKFLNFNVACSFFNVINYIIDFEDLERLFLNISHNLLPEGEFLFDCLDEEQEYSEFMSNAFEYEMNEIPVKRQIKSTYQSEQRMLYIQEDYANIPNSTIYHQYKIWNHEEIKTALEKGGFHIICCDKKKSLNSNCNKKNQVVYFLKKG